jgi:hypothetical protein
MTGASNQKIADKLRELADLLELCLPLIPSNLATLDPCNGQPYAY